MKKFAELYAALDESTKTTVKVAALVDYFRNATASDSAWAISFLIGRKPRQVVPSKLLREWAAELAEIPLWLFEESYHAVGDLAETIALLLPSPNIEHLIQKSLTDWVENQLQLMAKMPEPDKKQALIQSWQTMTIPERFIWNKLITGAFRVGVSQSLVTRALSELTGIEAAVLAHRMMGDWQPSPEFYFKLTQAESHETDPKQLYPFYLAHPLEQPVEELGEPGEWSAEWKWDGIRSQLIRRNGQTHIWSRGEELVTERYPELHPLAELLPDGTVIDGELLPWDFNSNLPLPFTALQKRIGRKTVTKKLLAEIPVVIVAYDLLEHESVDIRPLPFHERRSKLESMIRNMAESNHMKVSPVVNFNHWNELVEARSNSRQQMVEGLMLKRQDSPYRVGRKRGDWWKWKVQPLTMDCVMTMAQRGSGRRASLYSDYTFAVWDKPGGSLVTVAKAYSGLTDAEIGKIDAFVKKNTTDKFGPVRAVKPEIVMELAFEAIQLSPRHKSGIAVRFPRIVRIRDDKKPEDADTLDNLKQLLASFTQDSSLNESPESE